MNGRTAKAQRRADRERVDEFLRQAHDQLHRDDVDGAHEMLHAALGHESAELKVAPLAGGARFDDAFLNLCRAHGVRAAYVSVGEQTADGMARLISGGDAELCKLLDRAVRREVAA